MATPTAQPQHQDVDMELISNIEMQEYIQNNDYEGERYWQHLLQGWMKFVAPLTPSTVDGIARLKCVQNTIAPVEHSPEPILELLWAIPGSGRDSKWQFSGYSWLLLKKAWPTIWLWMQHSYHAHHAEILRHRIDASEKAFFTQRYQVFVGMLQLQHFLNPDRLQIPEILPMMADMWIREGTDKNAVNGFQAAVFSGCEKDSSLETIFLSQVISMCGNAEEAVYVACQRLDHHIGQTQPEYPTLMEDLKLFVAHTCQPEASELPSSLALAMRTSPGVPTTMMRVWAHTASSSFNGSVEHRSQILMFCMIFIAQLMRRSPLGHVIISDLLHQELLPLVVQSDPLIPLSLSDLTLMFNNSAATMIAVDLLPATFHREMLSLITRSVARIHKRGAFLPFREEKPLQKESLRETWSLLVEVLAERNAVYKSYSSLRKCSRSVFLCGNVECDKDNNGLLRRCSACNVLLYCSRKCQKRHWADHRALCDDMSGKAKGWVDMSYPNLHFLSYRVAYDMSVQHKVYISSAFTQNPLPAFYLNYVRLCDGDLSNITRMDTKKLADVTVAIRSSYPVSADDMLQKAWNQLSAAPGKAIPILVAIPRGRNDSSQMMIATVLLSNSPETMGVRWLYVV